MKKNLWVLGILGICLLTLSGCGTSNTGMEETENTSSESTSKVDIAECIKGCNILYKEENGKLSCTEMCNAAEKLNSDDVADCNDLDNKDTIITKDICIQGKAIDMKKPEYCEKIEDSIIKDTCYTNLAGEMKDTSLCKKVSNEFMKLGCEDTWTAEEE